MLSNIRAIRQSIFRNVQLHLGFRYDDYVHPLRVSSYSYKFSFFNGLEHIKSLYGTLDNEDCSDVNVKACPGSGTDFYTMLFNVGVEFEARKSCAGIFALIRHNYDVSALVQSMMNFVEKVDLSYLSHRYQLLCLLPDKFTETICVFIVKKDQNKFASA